MAEADPGISDDRDQRQKGFDSSARPTVHYPDSLDKGLGTPPSRRCDSSEGLNPRPSSIAGTDDGDSEDYDWSGEEDLEDEEAKFEQQMGVKSKPVRWNFKRIVISLFSTLVGSTFLAAALITPGVLIQFYWYKVNPTEHRRYVKDNVQAWLFWAAANLLISWYLAIAIDVIPILAQFFVAVSWGHVSEYTKTRIEMYDTVKDSIKPLLYAASGWASWAIIFGNIYDLHDAGQPNESRAPYTNRLSQVIEFLFFFALVICIKRMLSHAIAFSFHRTAYKDRVDSLQDALGVIEKLRDYRPKFTPRHSYRSSSRNVSSEREHLNSLNRASHDSSLPDSRSPLDHVRGDGEDRNNDNGDHTILSASTKKRRFSWKGKGKNKDRLSWTEMKHHKQRQDVANVEEAIEMYPSSSRSVSPSVVTSFAEHRYPPTPKHGSPRASLDGSHEEADTLLQAAKAIKHVVLHDARNIKGQSEGLASAAWNVSSPHEAKRLARSIFMKFKDRHRNYLLPSDFNPAFPDTATAEVAFRVFDKDDNGDISRLEVKSTLVKVYKERRFLSRSMRDVSAALKTLDQILFFLAMVILFFISLSVFGVEVGASLTSVYSLGIAASFIFKNTASSAFDAIMFLFVTHPYDTGDRVFVDQEVLVVKKVGLFATVFVRADGTETYYFNSQLFNKFITNVRRSGKTFENLTMQVAWRTPLAKLDALESSMNEWLSTEENRWFEPSTNITLQHIEFQRYLSLTIGIAHNSNWQDWGLRQARKTAFHAAVQYYCRQLEIDCFESPIPIVYGDSESRVQDPSPGNADGPVSPTSEKQNSEKVRLAEETEVAPKEMQATLGFLPPRSSQPSQLTRARKSKSKKTMYGRIEG